MCVGVGIQIIFQYFYTIRMIYISPSYILRTLCSEDTNVSVPNSSDFKEGDHVRPSDVFDTDVNFTDKETC